MKKQTKTTIGEMCNSRITWGFNASTQVKQNQKGKGSYNRQDFKKEARGW